MACKILVITKDNEVACAIQQTLTGADYIVRIDTTGADCISTIRNEIPDLVVLDESISIVRGHAILDHIYRYENLRNTPVIVLTDDKTVSDIFCADGPLVFFMRMPFQPNELLALIKRILQEVISEEEPFDGCVYNL